MKYSLHIHCTKVSLLTYGCEQGHTSIVKVCPYVSRTSTLRSDKFYFCETHKKGKHEVLRFFSDIEGLVDMLRDL